MLGDRCARQIDFDDFDRFEWILAMDQDNLEKLEAMRPRRFRGHLSLFLDFAPESGSLEVPDPYSGDATDFDRVLDLAEQGAAALLDAIRKSLDRRPG